MSPLPTPVPAPSRLRLLMVEDDSNDAELLHAYLAETGERDAEVLHACSLGEGLRLLQSHEIHLTLLDLDLPDSSGFHTLERMREAAAGPVVVISGNAHPSLVEEVLKRRAYDVVPKDELDAATLNRVLRLARQHYETGRSLRSTETRFRATFEHAAVGLAHVDLEGRIQLANERLCAILGYERAELVGLNFRDISHPEDREASSALRARLHAGEIGQFTLRKRYQRKAGTAFWAQLTVALVRDPDGKPEYEVTAIEDVSEAVHAEHQLRRSERRFRALIENSADGVVLLDRKGCILYGTPATARMLGYSRGELRGRPADELVHPDNREAYLRDMKEVWRAPGNRIAMRTRMRREDGVYRLFEGTTTNLLEDPSVGAVVANFRDVTERWLRERALADAQARSERLRRMYAALSAANESSAELADAPALYRRVCALLVEHAGLKLAAVRLLDRESGWSETVAHAGEPAAYLEQARVSVNGRAPDTLGPSARAVLEGRTVVCNDFLAEPTLAPWHACARESGIAGVMSVPLRRAGEAVGLLSLFAAETDWFDAELVGLAERMGQNLSQALDALDREARRRSTEQRAQLEHQVARQLADAESADEGLSEAIRAICQSEGWDCGRYFAFDESAGLLRVTEAWGVADPEVERFVAASRGMRQAPGAGLAGIVLQSGAPLWLEDVTVDPRVSAQGRAINGSMRSAFVFPVTLQGRCTGVLSITGRVIREPDDALLQTMLAIGTQVGQFLQRKSAEQAMRQSEARFRGLTGLSSDWYWEQNAELRFVATGGLQDARGGISDAQHHGLLRWELPGTEAASGSWDEHKAVLAARLPFRDLLLKRTAANGAVHYVSVSGEPMFDEQGAFRGYRGIAKDVTPSHEAMRALRENERRLSALFSNLPGMAYRCRNDASWASEFVSEGARALTGYAPEDFVAGRINFGELMHPEDRERVWNDTQEALRARLPFVVEYRLRTATGGEKRVWERGTGVYAPDGSVEALEGFIEDITARKHAEQRLAHLAQFDALTGLPNRALLHDRLQTTLVHTRRRQAHAGILFVDLDRFKLVNDTLGHYQGDALLRQVGQRLLACVRTDDTVGRISGDEFAVVLADLARPDDAAIVAQKALEALALPFDLGGNEAYVTASIGIAVFPGDGEDAETLLKNADMAMYRAKESGRNNCCFFTAEMNQRTLAKVQLNTDLRHALERREFRLHYQPKVDLDTGTLRGMEALLRWEHPARGMVSPGEFIPALEDSGLIVPVGEWVVEEACRQLAQWAAAGALTVPVAVNLSPKQFRRRDLDAVIRESLGRHGVVAEFLELEITESCLMENPEDAVRVMHSLRTAGLKISIDDFGTGYSSLSYLTRLPLSSLKIDRSFVRDAESSAEAASIVRAIIDMAQNLRLTVIAEGVETAEQAAFLRSHGCDQAQGFFYSRPVAAERIVERLARA